MQNKTLKNKNNKNKSTKLYRHFSKYRIEIIDSSFILWGRGVNGVLPAKIRVLIKIKLKILFIFHR